MRSTTPLKQTWVPPLVNLRTLLQYGVFKHISALSPLRSKKEALDTADRLQALTPEAGQNIFTSNVVAMAPLSSWLKREEVKTK
jgi:hypothetical protein